MKTLGSLSDQRFNNFDFIRFFAATMVIISHSFLLSYGDEKLELVNILTQGQINAGSLGVYIFFIISGFLITRSYDRNPNLVTFLKSRCLRIFPGLALVLLFTVFIIGPIVWHNNLLMYFRDINNYKYLLNIDLYHIPSREFNLGFFWKNVSGIDVNGSLWTLYYEFICYLIVAVLGFTKTLRKPFVFVLFFFVYIMSFVPFPGHPYVATTFYFFRYFSTGMLFYMLRNKIPNTGYLFILSIFIIIASNLVGKISYILPIPLTYIVFYIAYFDKLKMQNFAKYGDISYGLYIFSFPIQQLVTHVFDGKMNAYLNFIMSFPIVVVLAFLSWHFVEKKFMGLKSVKFTRIIKEAIPRRA